MLPVFFIDLYMCLYDVTITLFQLLFVSNGYLLNDNNTH